MASGGNVHDDVLALKCVPGGHSICMPKGPEQTVYLLQLLGSAMYSGTAPSVFGHPAPAAVADAGLKREMSSGTYALGVKRQTATRKEAK